MQLEGLTLGAMAFFALGTTSAALGFFLDFIIVAEVNRKLPEGEQFSYWWMHPAKWDRILAHYKQMYPNGRLNKVARLMTALTIIFLFLMAWSIGAFS